MKKILFLLLFVSAVSVNAQGFDENDLIGTWITTGLSYPIYKISNIESITFGDNIYEHFSEDDREATRASGIIKNITYTNLRYDANDERTTNKKILDYFISNNRLHIVAGDSYTLHFIIEELTATTLKVKTYEGLSFSFTKDSSSSAVRSISLIPSANESTYNLSGQKVDGITADGIYIQNGQKKVMKK